MLRRTPLQCKHTVGELFSEEDGIFYGKVMGIRSLISYEGESAKELLDDFHGAIDDYLETCKAEGKQPEIAFKGSFNIRLSPDLLEQPRPTCRTRIPLQPSGFLTSGCFGIAI